MSIYKAYRVICLARAFAVLFVAGIFWETHYCTRGVLVLFLVGAFGGFFRLGWTCSSAGPLKDGHASRGNAPGAVRLFLFNLQQIHWLYNSGRIAHRHRSC